MSKRGRRESKQSEQMEFRSLRATNRPSYAIPDSDEDEKNIRRKDKGTKTNQKSKDRYVTEDGDDETPRTNHRGMRSGNRDSLSQVVQRPSEKLLSSQRQHSDRSDDDLRQSKRKIKPQEKRSSHSGQTPSPEVPKKYSFRDRDQHHRTQLNVTHLGGDGQSYENIASDSESMGSEEEEDSVRVDSNENENEQEDEDEELEGEQEDIDEEEEEDEDDESPIKKYSFRDRTRHRRETLNVSHLGGDGQSYLKNTKPQSISNSNPTYATPRLYLGGKIPAHNRNENRRPHPTFKRNHYARRNHFDSSSESSSDSSKGRDRKKFRNDSGNDEETHFREHEQDRLRAEMASIVPLSLGHSGTNALNGMGGSMKDKASKRDISRADVNPIAIDSSIGFSSIGGLDNHVRALKEMVVLPLLYPDVFHRFDTQPPRGVLFVGPPGTGKTLTARALANSLSTAGGPSSGSIGGRKVSFFMRKGADCLSKWVGEGERQLRLLFEQAKRYEPSIIFFDEIDGLAPVRSIKQDQIHASIVSTLLALMDGLDSRGQVVVIGATNRPDAIDPALRRPGRFDRELMFSLPDADARRAIIQIHTANWQPPLDNFLKEWIVESSSGYCGADIKALCSEAAIISLRRAYPQVYQSNLRLQIDPSTINITRGDFAAAFSRVIPASRRAASTAPSRSLDTITKPLLSRHIDATLFKVKQVFALADCISLSGNGETNPPVINFGKGFEEEWIAALTDVQDRWNSAHNTSSSSSTLWDPVAMTSRSRVLISGRRGMSHSDIAGIVLQRLESFQVFTLDINAIISDGAYFSPEQALISRIFEARKCAPCVIYFPDIVGWCKVATDSLKTILISLLDSFPITIPILWISTFIWDGTDHLSSESASEDSEDGLDEKVLRLVSWLSGGISSLSGKNLPTLLKQMSSHSNVVALETSTKDERYSFFNQFFSALPTLPQTFYDARKTFFESRNQKLAIAIASPPLPIESESQSMKQQRELHPDPSAGMTASDNERNENYLREQRLFFWTALSELKREKKFASLIRPVDPEQVPDYYDVVTSPMDLETMRSKVDADLYPTFKCFLYDFEQIIFNAKEYNPLNSRDTRGRGIVSAAHHMLDIVKTHAFAFKERLGYDVFKRCEDLYFRRHGKFPSLNDDRTVMPEENRIYYQEIIHWHSQLKKEFEEEQSRVTRESSHKDDLQKESSSEMVEPSVVRQTRNQRKHQLEDSTATAAAHALDDQNIGNGDNGILISCDEKALRKRARAVKVKQRIIEPNDDNAPAPLPPDLSMSTASDIIPATADPQSQEENSQEISSEEPQLFQSPVEYDIKNCVLATAYETAIPLADKMRSEGLFQRLLEETLHLTDQWCISDLVTLYTNLKRYTREFQLQGNWNKMIEDIQETLAASSSEAVTHES